MPSKLRDLWNRQTIWSSKTFGTSLERGPVGPLNHLLLELEEVIKKPNDLLEWADCQILIWDSAYRMQMPFWDIKKAGAEDMWSWAYKSESCMHTVLNQIWGDTKYIISNWPREKTTARVQLRMIQEGLWIAAIFNRINYYGFWTAVEEKLAINEQRVWNKVELDKPTLHKKD